MMKRKHILLLNLMPIAALLLLAISSCNTSSVATSFLPQVEGTLVANDSIPGDYQGWSVSVSGDTAIVGAYRKSSSTGGQTGAAYVFIRSGDFWSQQAKLTPGDAAGSDYFGGSVAIDGNTAVVGTWRKNTYIGAAYVFVRSGSVWDQQAKLTASDGVSGDDFGWAVSVSGDTVVVGAYNKNNMTGAAYVFIRAGSTWNQQAKLTTDDGAANDAFGYSLSVAGDTAVVGAWRKNDFSGAAYVFVRSGASWVQQAKLAAHDGEINDLFGFAVSVHGEKAVVGAYGKNNNTGAVYVFGRSGSAWTQQAKITASEGTGTDAFGWSVSLSDEIVAVGAAGKNNNTGAVYVFRRSGTLWSRQAKLIASDGSMGDAFGWSVSMNRETVVAGAYSRNNKMGAAYVFS
jgi:hypothetical protein